MTGYDFEHDGFFVMRTPLLPLEFLHEWGTAGDEDQLRARLREIFEIPEIREALFVASPALEEALRREGATADVAKRDRLDAGLTKYLLRMAGRCTPFGLFAGVSVGTFGPTTELRLAPRSKYRRFTRLDMGYLDMMLECLVRDTSTRNAVQYRPNSTLYVIGDRARYIEHRQRSRVRSYFLVSASMDESLTATLDLAASGDSRENLARALVQDGIEMEEALDYVDELIDGQILVPDLALAVTGGDPMIDLEEQLASHEGLDGFARTLASVRAQLQSIDRAGVGVAPERYRSVSDELSAFPCDANIDRLFQVDMAKPGETLTLDESLLEEVARVAAVLGRIFGAAPADPFEDFKKAFVERWGDRQIPLLHALDEECGVGFHASSSVASDVSPLLAGLVFGLGPGEPRIPWGPLQDFLLRRVAEGRDRPYESITITDEDLSLLPDRSALLPSAVAVMLTLLPTREESGPPSFLWHGLSGPSGGKLLGRFCHLDPELLQGLRDHLRAEELQDPERVHCEIVHLPEGRIGNVIARPLLREHEIVFLARSGAPTERQIPLSDIRVSVRTGRVVLRSVRLQREIVPRLTNAHNFSMGIGVYRFLAMLQAQGMHSGLAWNWGPFESLAYLPRVTYRNAILSPARWTAAVNEIRPADGWDRTDPLGKFLKWAEYKKLPRWVGLREGDNILPVDLDNQLSLRALLDAIEGRPQFTLTELPGLGGDGPVFGPEGRFSNEVIIPLVRRARSAVAPVENVKKGMEKVGFENGPIRFLPGSEWLFVRISTAPEFADALLVNSLGPIIESLRRDHVANEWFFIRYSDPDFQIRLRIRGNPTALLSEALPRLHSVTSILVDRGLVTKVLYDTYDREMQRYGGPDGIEICESIFGIDSDATLELIALTPGDEGAVARWQLTLCGIDALLRDAGLDLEKRYSFADRMAGSYAREFNLLGSAKRPIQEKFRAERSALFKLLEDSKHGTSSLELGIEILRRRSTRLAPEFAELSKRDEGGNLSTPLSEILSSLIHMHTNRMMPTSARAHEAILYRFLSNLYDSKLARAGRLKRDRQGMAAPE